MDSNGLVERQNSPSSLRMLAAQRQLYRDSKKINTLIFITSVLLPFICSLLRELVPSYPLLSIGSCVISILGMIIGVFFAKYVNKRQTLAAKIQLLFDVEVFQLKWDERFFGSNSNTNSIIAEKSMKILADMDKRNLLLDWYPKQYDAFPLLKSIPLCQYANINWDTKTRSLFKACIITLIAIMISAIIVLGVIKKESLEMFLVRLSFIIPLVKWLSSKIISIDADLNRLEELKGIFLLDKEYDSNQLIVIQTKIQAHREKCTLIPDWFYLLNRKKQEEIMNITADIDASENRKS